MKTKMLALLEIVVVLCSLLLVATSLGIATDQNQELQKVSACTVTTTSEDDFVLGVYGNANEDDTIDMRDLTYVKLIFFGERPETELADAKYDGEINPLDFVQIKLIIVGKENELTVVQYLGTPPDITEEPVTISIPTDRIVTASSYACEAICTFGLEDTIVGVDGFTKKVGEIAELIKAKEEIGVYSSSMDVEKVISLEPDVVIASTYFRTYYPVYEEQLSYAGIPMLLTDLDEPEKYAEEFGVLGWLMSNQEKAEALIKFDKELYELIDGSVSEIPENEKPSTVYGVYCPCPPGTFIPEDDDGKLHAFSFNEAPPCYIAGSGTSGDNRIVRAGGINAFADIESYQQVDTEAIIGRDPQILIMDVYPGYAGFVECGYEVADSSSMHKIRGMFMNSTGWDCTSAVQNGDAYMICNSAGGLHSSIYALYMAKWLHPDRFEDLDPIAMHEDWLDEFLGIPYKGVYAYPTPWNQGTDSSFKGVNCAE
jgi:iron complex transport system substrate-binding protein